MFKLLDRFEEAFCATALLFTALVLFLNVVLRYLFKASTSWAEELIRYLMIWITFIGGSLCARQGAHIRMDFLMTLLPRWTHRWIDGAIYAIAGVFCAAMTIYGIRLVAFTVAMGQMSPALKMPMWVPYLAIPLGSAMMTLRFFQLLLAQKGACR